MKSAHAIIHKDACPAIPTLGPLALGSEEREKIIALHLCALFKSDIQFEDATRQEGREGGQTHAEGR